jgi:hypothetical protein
MIIHAEKAAQEHNKFIEKPAQERRKYEKFQNDVLKK